LWNYSENEKGIVKMLFISYDETWLGCFDGKGKIKFFSGLIGLFDGIIVGKKKEYILGKMMGRMLEFLFANACLNVAGNYC
jgi:hypothetical protein